MLIFCASVSGFINEISPETDHAELLHLITQEQSMRMNIESQLHTVQAQVESLQTLVHNLTGNQYHIVFSQICFITLL